MTIRYKAWDDIDLVDNPTNDDELLVSKDKRVTMNNARKFPTYDDAAARDADLTNPSDGMVCQLRSPQSICIYESGEGCWVYSPTFFNSNNSGLHFLETYKPDLWLSADRSRCGVTGARDFDGTDQYFALASALESGDSAFFISAYVYIDDLTVCPVILGATTNSSPDSLYVAGDGTLHVRIGANWKQLTTTALSTGVWYHILVTRDTDNLWSVYIDGKLQNTVTQAGTISYDAVGGMGAVSNSDVLVHLDSGDQNGKPVSVWGDGQFVYVAKYLSGLHVYSVDGSGTLTHLSSDDQGGAVMGVWGDGQFVYLANFDGGLHVYSVDGSGTLTHLDSDHLHNCEAFDVWSDGQFVYLANYDGGLCVYSVDGSGTLTLLVSYIQGNWDNMASGVWGDDQFVYLANGDGGLHVYSVDGSGTPTYLDSNNQGGEARNVWGDGQFVYLASKDSGLHVYSVDGSGTLTCLDSDNQDGKARDVWGDGQFVYLANDDGGLHVYSVDGSGTLTHLDSDNQGGKASGVWSDGQFVYSANYTGGLHVYSINNYHNGRLGRIAYGTTLPTSDQIAEMVNNGQGATWDELSSGLQSSIDYHANGLEVSGTLYDQCGGKNGTDNNGVGHAAGPRVEQAADTSGNGYHGTLTNMDTPDCWSSDVPAVLGGGYSLLFDGSDDDVRTADGDHAFAVSGLDVITATIWVKWSGMEHPDNYNGLLSLGGYTFGFGIDGPDKAIRSVLHTSEGYYYAVTGNDVLSADQWLHITLRYDDTGDRKQYIFLDGLEKAVSSPLIGVVSDVSSVPFLFGKGFKSGGYLQGHIAQVCVYHEALSDADIAALAVGNSITPTPVMQYDLNDGPQQGAPANGDPVASLESRDGQRYLFNQDTASRRPTFVESGINSQPVLEFDGTDDYLEIAQAILSGERGTVFAVWHITEIYRMALSAGTGDDSVLSVGQYNSYELRVIYKNADDNNMVRGEGDNNTDTVAVVTSNGENYGIRVNGVSDESMAVSRGRNDGLWFGDLETPDKTYVGKSVQDVYYWNGWDGYIAEIIVYDDVVLPTDVRDAIESYLATKYGITLKFNIKPI